MSIVPIKYESLADPEIVNNNFSYLDERITDTVSKIYTNSSGFESKLSTLANTLNEKIKFLNDTVRPIGQPIIRLDNTLLEDEIRLEGKEVSKAKYAKLYAIYGNTYGKASNTDNFVLPNFINRATWGATNFGYIAAGLPDHSHTLSAFTWDSRGIAEDGRGNPDYGHQRTLTTSKASDSNSIYGKSSTVQPPAIKVRVVTRYK